jgi:hypothetical protein
MTPGRGFTALNMKGERIAFGFWMRDLINQHGGRAKVSEVCGISTDSLSKWAGGRAIPSKINIEKLINGEVIPYESMESMLAESPWMDHKYLKRVPKMKTAAKPKPEPRAEVEVWDVVEEPVRHNLMDAVLAEPGLNSTQRAQLAALIAMIVNGVDVQVSVTVR